MIKLLVDTNVFIDAIFRNDTYGRELMAMECRGEIAFVMSVKTYTELVHKLIEIGGKAKRSLDDMKKPITAIIHTIRRAEIITPLIKTNNATHIADEKFYECAVCSDIDYFITHDSGFGTITNKILNNKGKEIRIRSAYQFVKIEFPLLKSGKVRFR